MSLGCVRPLEGYRAPGGRFTYDVKSSVGGEHLTLRCGQCINCRLRRRFEWAMRIIHESTCYAENSFITLTYADGSLPVHGTLVKAHFQDFMKRLRSRLSPLRIRYFQCGEYGSESGRAHYHAIIFGYGFPDRVLYRSQEGGSLYVSRFLDSVWGHGISTIGDVSFNSASYVAGYVVKKITGEAASDGYWSLDERTGELHQVEEEYARCSLRPAIGIPWLERNWRDVYPADRCPIPFKRVLGSVPRAYDRWLAKEKPKLWASVRKARIHFDGPDWSGPDFRSVEKVARAELELKTRRKL